jgi:hypothetical protein
VGSTRQAARDDEVMAEDGDPSGDEIWGSGEETDIWSTEGRTDNQSHVWVVGWRKI